MSAAPAQETIPTNPSYLGVTLSNVRINGGGNTGFVSPGSSFSVSLDYSIVDADCPACIDQIQIGFSTGDPLACAYDGIPSTGGATGSATLNLTAPATPGVYYLGFDRAQHFSCAQALANGWWTGTPDPTRYIASVATVLVVNSPNDAVDANPGDGVCETATAGECTLRAAVQEANALAGADTISIPAGVYTLSIPGADEDAAATGDLDSIGDLTISGAGIDATIIDAGQPGSGVSGSFGDTRPLGSHRAKWRGKPRWRGIGERQRLDPQRIFQK